MWESEKAKITNWKYTQNYTKLYNTTIYCTKKQLKHTQDIFFLLSDFTYPKISNQVKQSHKGGYQHAK